MTHRAHRVPSRIDTADSPSFQISKDKASEATWGNHSFVHYRGSQVPQAHKISLLTGQPRDFIQQENENPPKAFRMQENRVCLFSQHRHLVIGLLGTFSQIGGVLQNLAQLPVKAAGTGGAMGPSRRSREGSGAAPGSAAPAWTHGHSWTGRGAATAGITVTLHSHRDSTWHPQ